MRRQQRSTRASNATCGARASWRSLLAHAIALPAVALPAVAFLAVALLAGWALGLPSAALAQRPYPMRPVVLVVPFAAGGPTDTVARELAAGLQRALGQPVQVDNRPGLGGTRAPAELASAPPGDGHTLLLHHIGMATAPTLFRHLSYDPQRDFEPLGLVVEAPMVLLSRPTLGLHSARHLSAWLRTNEATTSVAYAGLGAASHLCGLMLNAVLGVDLISVPYAGTGPALAHVEKGGADILCDQTTASMRAIREGRVKAYAVTMPRRLDVLPEVPSVTEEGLPELQLSIWHGLYAPRGTPAMALATLTLALQEVLASETFQSAMRRVGVVPTPPEQATAALHRAHLSAQIARWRPVILKARQFAD